MRWLFCKVFVCSDQSVQKTRQISITVAEFSQTEVEAISSIVICE